ncbi:hypothetical protein ACHAW5_004254 [Stephanodiscus triporus]|uniref:Methyltransferase type 12 domain-containing protein n=1 Tax=Stephanodiscus triporus TaxID=2934178 RepID=A0ABD3MC53_9STRA
MIQKYNAYIDWMINNHEAVTTEYDDEGFHYAQTQVLTMSACASKLYYGYGTILSDLSPSDCLHLMAEESLLIDTEQTTSFAIRTTSKDDKDEKSAKVVCETNALNAMQMAVNLFDGNNILALHMLAAMTGGEDDDDGGYGSQERASNEFVSALFDDFADTFDEKLGALAYQVPKLVGEVAYDVLRMSQKESIDSILDAGCGTGLAGQFLQPPVEGPLVGVDLSNQMLQKAAQCTLVKGCGLKVEDSTVLDDAGVDGHSSKPLYDKLALSDLETVTLDDLVSGLSGEKIDGFDLIVAADVFVYIGNLEKILLNFAKLSNGDDSKESYLIFLCK